MGKQAQPKHGDRRYQVTCCYMNPLAIDKWDSVTKVNEVCKSRPKAFGRAVELAREHKVRVYVSRQRFRHKPPSWPNPGWENEHFWEFVPGKQTYVSEGEAW